ncbi:multidrug efflux SMR transporter [Paenibacillus sp. F411]|uniref:DMT family transporter n=1 Tax=unclassified Paenibacillus TaxID=185978 RepID=UPI001AAE8C86|nr:multidrug efflux SMR transporter [Paenibacillus sp. F411]MBO2944734.1 multidrug efflux SMR transporter [Paenibacillus sp. F411]
MSRNWLYVWIGGLIEIVWVSGLKHSTTALEWIGTVAAIIASFYLIVQASKRLPVGTVYAVFTGIGTAGTVAAEMLLFGEPFSLSKVLLIGVLLGGVIGLKLVTAEPSGKEGSSVREVRL